MTVAGLMAREHAWCRTSAYPAVALAAFAAPHPRLTRRLKLNK